MTRRKVLVTGMSGLIGTALKNNLGEKYELSALNRRPVDGVINHRADVADFESVRRAAEGVDSIVHLAAASTVTAPWEDYLHYNIVGTYNVFEAARLAGVRRVVFGSSGGVVMGWESTEPFKALTERRYSDVPKPWPMITKDTPPWPKTMYSCTKQWGESLARHYSDDYGLSGVVVRIGRVNKEDRPVNPRDYSVWCSQRDISQMVERCIEAPASLRFDCFYAVSDNKWGFRDIDHARRTIAYAPQDSADTYG